MCCRCLCPIIERYDILLGLTLGLVETFIADFDLFLDLASIEALSAESLSLSSEVGEHLLHSKLMLLLIGHLILN